MCKHLIICLTFILLLSAENIYSQDLPIEWEEIPLSDLQMTEFPGDSNASAVILCDFGESKFNNDFDLLYTRHLRIKILNENGYDWGTHSIRIYTGEYGERLDEIEGITYSLDENGDIIENELDSDDIFEEEETENYIKYNFTMPALKPGCIIDIRYEIVSYSIFRMRDWTFQMDEPVLWSEYRVTHPSALSYAFVSLGFEPWTVRDDIETTQIFQGEASRYVGNGVVKCKRYRWVLKNAPALRDEPYITTVDDYKNRVTVQLAGYAFIGIPRTQVLQDWKTLANELLDSRYFGDMIDVTGDVEDLTLEIIKNLTTPEEKLRAIYNWITRSIVWTGEHRVYADIDADDVIEYKKGNSAEITFLLLSMLKSAGINGDPVILSTRANGKIQELYPIVSQFNYTIARVITGSKIYYVDATDPLRALDLLPIKILNTKALVVKQDKPEWALISSQKTDVNKTVINVNLKDDGSLTADFEEMYGDYSSLKLRRDFKDKSEIDFARELFDTESSGFKIDSAHIVGSDSVTSPFRIRVWISSSDYTQIGGDLIYFNPTMINRLTDNPFKTEKRKFSIDYSYPSQDLIVTNVTLPPGYQLKEVYENKSYVVSNGASYKRIVDSSGNIIQIMNRTDIKEAEIKANYYTHLREFYSRIIAAQSEMMVLGPADNSENTSEVKVEGSK